MLGGENVKTESRKPFFGWLYSLLASRDNPFEPDIIYIDDVLTEKPAVDEQEEEKRKTREYAEAEGHWNECATVQSKMPRDVVPTTRIGVLPASRFIIFQIRGRKTDPFSAWPVDLTFFRF